MNDSHPQSISPRTGMVLLLIAIVVPLLLSYLMADRGLFGVPLLVVPLILMAVWRDLGFVLGLFLFWGTLILLGQSSISPGQVDHMLPGITVALGWIPYVVFYGPVFLLMKSTERYRAKWTRGNPTRSGEL